MRAKRLLQTAAALGGLALATALSGLAMAAPQPEPGIGLPRDVSLDGHRIDWLINVTNGLTATLFVIMVAWLLIAALKHNEKHEATYDHGDSRRSMFIALSMAGSVFFIVDGNLFLNSTMDLENVFHNFEKVEKDPNAVRIEINAHQWAWDARYAGPDGKFNTRDDIVSLNDVRIPEGVPVIFEVASTDVLHSFNLPHFRTKIDAVPGTVNRIWIQGTTPGEYEIGCAQHCGTNHYKMKGIITVLSKEDYARWAAEMSANCSRVYNEADEGSHWGWDWKGI
ncbi:MAG: cytochrome c oxidase subunit II [Polyangiaceae bacterium]|nr:cytochrome c oxidase subunit II [Polyangiaceae bacterium]